MGEQIKIDTDNVLAREVDGELVLLDVRQQLYIGGNRSTAVLWPLLEQGATNDQLVRALVDHFGINSERAHADVGAFLAELREHDLLVGNLDGSGTD